MRSVSLGEAGMIGGRQADWIELVRQLVGRRTGILRELQKVPRVDGDAPLRFAAAVIAEPQRFATQIPKTQFACGGAGRTWQQAAMAAMGEGVERYCAASYPLPADLRPAVDLQQSFVMPESLAQFSTWQRRPTGFPYPACSDRQPIRWTEGHRLSDGARQWVPAAAVFLPYRPIPGEPLVAPGTSTGLCCAESREAALLGAILEIVERDALAVTWLTGSARPQIAPERLVEIAGDLLPLADRCEAYDLTSEVGLPIALVVCRGPGPHGPIMSVGSACRPSRAAALQKAALEAAQTRVYVRQLAAKEPDWQPDDRWSNVTDFSHHARLYTVRPDLAQPAFAFLPNATVTQWAEPDDADPTAGPNELLRRTIDRLNRAGHDGVWIDLTQPWAQRLGLVVVRAVIPSLMPLHGHHGLAQLRHPRLRAARPARAGQTEEVDFQRWPFPHPFA